MLIAGGDRDCSSAVISAYQAAGLAVNASTTRDMRQGFLATGKFEVWETASTTAQRGDIYLNDADHTAMCVDDGTGAYGYDALAEFSLNELGDIIGGQVGDQTGNESSIHAYYDFPWNCTLHCLDRELADRAAAAMEHLCNCPNHGYSQGYARYGDGSTEQVGSDAPAPSDAPPMPSYRVFTRECGWLGWMRGLACQECACGDDHAGVSGCWVYDVEFTDLGPSGWYEIERADGSKSRNSSGNTDSPVTGITVYYDTPNPSETGYWNAKYQAHWLGSEPGWGKWEYDDDDGGAGKDADSPIDMFRLTLAKA